MKNFHMIWCKILFLRLITYRGEICLHTVKHLLYIIARNLVNDYLRRYYKTQEVINEVYENTRMEELL